MEITSVKKQSVKTSTSEMKTSSSKKEFHSSGSESALDLTKLGGNDWLNAGRFKPQSTAIQHKIFERQATDISNSDAIEQMLKTKREKKQRQFVPTEKS